MRKKRKAGRIIFFLLRLGHPSAAGDQRSPAGRGLMPDPLQKIVSIFLKFFFLKFFFGSLGNGPRLWGEWVYNTPIF
jgi:hypothetical protein